MITVSVSSNFNLSHSELRDCGSGCIMVSDGDRCAWFPFDAQHVKTTDLIFVVVDKIADDVQDTLYECDFENEDVLDKIFEHNQNFRQILYRFEEVTNESPVSENEFEQVWVTFEYVNGCWKKSYNEDFVQHPI